MKKGWTKTHKILYLAIVRETEIAKPRVPLLVKINTAKNNGRMLQYKN